MSDRASQLLLMVSLLSLTVLLSGCTMTAGIYLRNQTVDDKTLILIVHDSLDPQDFQGMSIKYESKILPIRSGIDRMLTKELTYSMKINRQFHFTFPAFSTAMIGIHTNFESYPISSFIIEDSISSVRIDLKSRKMLRKGFKLYYDLEDSPTQE